MYPCEHPTLGKETTIHLLPSYAIVLHNRLVWDPEGTASRKAPICRIKSDRRLLECFTCATQRKKATRRQVWEDKNKYVQRKIGDRCHLV
jgi:hypothetical protein